MVTIVDYKNYQSEDGKKFCSLVIQGQLEAVKSKESERIYFTARTVQVPCTLNEEGCKKMIGMEMEGDIRKVEVEPYEYNIPETDEFITLSHRYEYVSLNDEVIERNVVKQELVI